MTNKKKEENDVKKHFLHIAFSENELEIIKKYSKDIGITISEFLRDSIRDKINKIENPNNLTEKTTIDIRPILEMVTNNSQKIDEVIEKLNLLTKVKDTLNGLSSMVHRPALKEKETKLVELLKTHKSLKIQKIMELISFTKEDVYDVISNDKIFTIDIKTGGIKLNDTN